MLMATKANKIFFQRFNYNTNYTIYTNINYTITIS